VRTASADLRPPVTDRDHRRGPDDAPVTLVAYGDYECPYTRRAQREIDDILVLRGDRLRYVYRHFPLSKIHPHAAKAAEAAEAAAAQGRFWEYHTVLFPRQRALEVADLVRYAGELGLDTDRFEREVQADSHAQRIREDVRSGAGSGVQGTPTLFVNGVRRDDPFHLEELLADVDRAS
jgi:protein-disulfide isomerase